MVRLDYTIDLDFEVNAPADFVLAVAAAKTPAQRVITERVQVNLAATTRWFTDPHFGNRLLWLRVDTGTLHITYAATVDIRHSFAEPAALVENTIGDIPADVLPFLAASRYCQSDRLVEFAHTEFGQVAPGYARADAIAAWVHDHVRFQPGVSTTSTTAIDTLADRRGVCRDFAHLMIALCRAINIPARFVTGVDYGADPALGPCDFHAYAEAWLGNRWYLFDASRISPTTGLVRIGTGRDAADAPFATIYGDVRTFAPRVAVTALDDLARGFRLPQAVALAVSTAASSDPGVASPAGHEAVPMPFLLQPLPGAHTARGA